MAKQAGFVTIALFLLSNMGLAQFSHYDVGVTVGPVLSKQSSGNGTVLTPTNSGVVVATARVRFSKKFSIAANFGRTKNSQNYFVSPNEYRVQGPVTEFGGAALFSFLQTKKLEGFALGGMSALVFTPKVTAVDGVASSLPAISQTKPAPVYGLGVDYHVYHRFAVRVQYRGLFYKAPDFNVANFFTGAYGHMAEGTVGLVFKF
jgi:opacity protein-like surface antigen